MGSSYVHVEPTLLFFFITCCRQPLARLLVGGIFLDTSDDDYVFNTDKNHRHLK
jgi:hypothetical protein